ncbi:unnamed protein product, partial [Brassica oleracea var. botrytis]
GEAVADLKQLFPLAQKFGYSEWIQFVCGLSYYTGIVFERFDRKGSCELYVVVGDMIDYSQLMVVMTFLLVVLVSAML